MTLDINEFENRVEDHLMSGLFDHYRARLARKHGRKRLAKRWFAEMRTRILVTRNTRHQYITYAPVYEYGILGLDALPHIEPSRDYATNATAQLISRAFMYHELRSRLSFVLALHPEGRHVFQTIG